MKINLKKALEKMRAYAQFGTKIKSVTRVIHGLHSVFWGVFGVVSRIQISVDILMAEGKKEEGKPRRGVYVIGASLLVLFILMFPDRIPSILSSLNIDPTPVLERTQELFRTVRKLLPTL
jgi:hypothetical protein